MDRRTFLAEGLIGVTALLTKTGIPPQIRPTEEGMWVAPVLKVDHPNGNKRIYPMPLVENLIWSWDYKNVKLGQLGMPEDGLIHIAEVSHRIVSVYVMGDYLMAEISITNTPKGEILKKLLEEDADKVAFRTMGVGSGKVDDNGCLVIDMYELTGINALLIHEAVTL